MRRCNGSCEKWKECKKNRFNPCEGCKHNDGDTNNKSLTCSRCTKNTCAFEPIE